jgi:ketosteroid isomerase-like protein
VIDDEAWLAAWDEPDLDAIRSFSADDLEVTAALAAIEPRHYEGRDAAVRWLSELRQRIKVDWSAKKLSHLADDVVVVEGELRFRDPAATGAERQPYAVLMRLRGEKVRWIGTFVTMADAREAWELGVGE